MRKINILYYDNCPGFGGPPRSLLNLIGGLDRNVYCPIVATKDWDEGTMREFQGVEFIRVRGYEKLHSLQRNALLFFPCKIAEVALKIIEYRNIIKRKNISLVHTNNTIVSAYLFYIACKLSGIPCVSHIRQTEKLTLLEKIFSVFADKIIAINRYAYALYRRDIPDAKLMLVHNGVKLDDFSYSRNEYFKDEINARDTLIVGYASRIVAGKGQKEFVLAAKEVLHYKPNVIFLIVGDGRGGFGGYYQAVRDLVEKEQLAGNVFLTGWRKDIRNVVSAMDVSVFCPTTSPEGMPNAIIESMALQKPVIATSIPGVDDLVMHGVTGFLVPPGDIQALADKIRYLLDNPEIARTMGEAGRKRVEEEFNLKKTQDTIFKIYEDVLRRYNLFRE